MQLLRWGWLEWEWGERFSQCLHRWVQQRGIRAHLRFVATFSPLCSPVWTQEEQLLHRGSACVCVCVCVCVKRETVMGSSVQFLDQCIRLRYSIIMEQNNSFKPGWSIPTESMENLKSTIVVVFLFCFFFKFCMKNKKTTFTEGTVTPVFSTTTIPRGVVLVF